MKKQNWISFADFEHKYDLKEDSLHAFRAMNKKHTIAFRKKGKSNQVDEVYFLRRHEFKKKVQLRAQDVYYLISEHFSDADIARFLSETFGGTYSSYQVYLSSNLFSASIGTILSIEVPKRNLKLFRFWWQIERRIRRRGASIAKILDRRAGLL